MYTHNSVCQTCELTFMIGHVNTCSYLWKLETWRFICKGLTVIASLVFLDFPRVSCDCLHMIWLSSTFWICMHGWGNMHCLSPISYFLAWPFPTSNRLLLAFVLPQIMYRLGYAFWLCSYLCWVNYDTFYRKKLGCCQILKQDHLLKKLYAGSTYIHTYIHILCTIWPPSSVPFYPSCLFMFCNLTSKSIYYLFINSKCMSLETYTALKQLGGLRELLLLAFIIAIIHD